MAAGVGACGVALPADVLEGEGGEEEEGGGGVVVVVVVDDELDPLCRPFPCLEIVVLAASSTVPVDVAVFVPVRLMDDVVRSGVAVAEAVWRPPPFGP